MRSDFGLRKKLPMVRILSFLIAAFLLVAASAHAQQASRH